MGSKGSKCMKILCFLGIHRPKWHGAPYTMSISGYSSILLRDRICGKCGCQLKSRRYELSAR